MTDTTIYHAMLVGASMGIAICASPEILILGLLMAANRTPPNGSALFPKLIDDWIYQHGPKPKNDSLRNAGRS